MAARVYHPPAVTLHQATSIGVLSIEALSSVFECPGVLSTYSQFTGRGIVCAGHTVWCIYLRMHLYTSCCSLAEFLPKEYVKVKGMERAIFQVCPCRDLAVR